MCSTYDDCDSLGHVDFDSLEALDNDIVPIVANHHHRVD